MAEPKKNTYVVTIVLRGVKKRDVLRFVKAARAAARVILGRKAKVFTAHLKDETH